MTFAPFIQWTNLPVWQRPLSVRLAIQATAPTGQYSPNDPINAGADAWQVSPYLAFTWRISNRWEISGRGICDWSGRSNQPPASLGATNSQAGAQFAQNLSVSAAITDDWRIGVASYGLWQLDDTRSVWSAPTTDTRLKKRIVRTVIHEVVADIDTEAAEIMLTIHWVGGIHTEIRLPRRRKGQRNSTASDTVAAVRQLVLIASDDLIAGILNRNGLTRPPA